MRSSSEDIASPEVSSLLIPDLVGSDLIPNWPDQVGRRVSPTDLGHFFELAMPGGSRT